MPERLKGCRILIVEDEYYIGAALEDAFTVEGAEVTGPIARAEQAKSLLSGHVWDAVVLDIKLVGEDGYELADDLAQRQIPFVFATAYGPESIPDRFKTAARWEKPYDLKKVLDDLVRILRRDK